MTKAILGLLILAISCGSPSSKKPITDLSIFISEEEVSDILNNQEMECWAYDENKGCPSGVTRLLTKNKKSPTKWSVCSGFMVSPTKFVTNNHCISSQEKCKNTYVVIYQKNGAPKTARCNRVIHTDNDGLDVNDPLKNIDITIAEIDTHYNGEFIETKSRSLERDEELSLWVVDHTGTVDASGQNFYHSRITELKCKKNNSSTKKAMELEYCPVIGGNSGSVAMTNDGFLAGLVFAGNTESILASPGLQHLRRDRDSNINIRNSMALATSIDYLRHFFD